MPETRYVGDVGLDGTPESRPHWREQERVFEQVLRFSERAGGRILTVHSRRAAREVVDALERVPGAGTAILHWFTGSKAELERAVAVGCWFSVGAQMVTSQRGRDALATMPRNRVLTETDGPFGMMDGRPLPPAEVSRPLQVLASTWRCTVGEARSTVASNLNRLAASHPASVAS